MAAPEKIIELRRILADKFGCNALFSSALFFKLGLPLLDKMGVPQAALTEIVSAAAAPGGGLLLYALLHAVLRQGERVILIDGRSGFAPKGLPQAELRRLLWIRCGEAWEAIKAADLAVRDGNVPLLVLLLTLNPAKELRRIPATAWHRLQMLAEKSAVTLLAFTPQAQIGCARLRLSVQGSFPLARLQAVRSDLMPELAVQVERRRMGKERMSDEEPRRAACA